MPQWAPLARGFAAAATPAAEREEEGAGGARSKPVREPSHEMFSYHDMPSLLARCEELRAAGELDVAAQAAGARLGCAAGVAGAA